MFLNMTGSFRDIYIYVLCKMAIYINYRPIKDTIDHKNEHETSSKKLKMKGISRISQAIRSVVISDVYLYFQLNRVFLDTVCRYDRK